MNYILTIIDPAAESVLTKICVELEIPVSIVFHGRGTAIKSMLDLLGIESHERRVFIAIADGEKSKRYIEEQKKKTPSRSAGTRYYGCRAREKRRRRTGSELFERKRHGGKIHKTGEI